jgi:hypothetical protein
MGNASICDNTLSGGVEEISSSEYAIDGNVARLMWMPAVPERLCLLTSGQGCLQQKKGDESS